MTGKFDINLLPDVKQEFIKSQRTKRMFIAGAFLVSAACVGLVILLFLWTNVQQKQHISNLQEDIDNYIKDLKETPDVDKILTIQNQLNALPGLHDEKPAVTRLSAFLSNVVPQNIELNEVTVSFEDNEMVISGSGIDFKSVNTFADTLKNVLYYQQPEEGESVDDADKKNVFSSVLLQEIGKTDEVSSFQITATFSQEIFDSSIPSIIFEVPSITSSQSEQGRPQFIFNDELAPQPEEVSQ